MRLVTDETHLERLFVFEHFGEGLASLDAEGVASEVNFFEIGDLVELVEVWLDVGLGVELEALTNEGEDFRIVRHGGLVDDEEQRGCVNVDGEGRPTGVPTTRRAGVGQQHLVRALCPK